MIFTLRIVLTAALCAAVQLVMPWWGIAVACALGGFVFGGKGFAAWFCGLLGAGLVWFGYAYWLDWQSSSVLGGKLAELFQLPNALAATAATGLAAGLVGAFAALAGNRLRLIIDRATRSPQKQTAPKA